MANYRAVPSNDIIDPTKIVWYVTFADGPNIGTRQSLTGYKNEESAKRRIRDLKRKDALKADGDTGTDCIGAQVAAAHDRDMREAEADLNADNIGLPNVEKLAASSAYGKSKSFDVMATIDPDFAESFERTVPRRQVGCYPAIPKRAYLR